MFININDYPYNKTLNPFQDFKNEEEALKKKVQEDLKKAEKEQQVKWQYWLASNFPLDYETRRKFAFMSIEELVDYFYENQNEFDCWKEFIEERCNAEKVGGYATFCFLVKQRKLLDS